MRRILLATATSVAIVGLTLPTLAADAVHPTSKMPPIVAADGTQLVTASPLDATVPSSDPSQLQTQMQAQLDKCLADGSLTAEQVQAMSDTDLLAALNTCSQSAEVFPPVIADTGTSVAEPGLTEAAVATPVIAPPVVATGTSSRVKRPGQVATGASPPPIIGGEPPVVEGTPPVEGGGRLGRVIGRVGEILGGMQGGGLDAGAQPAGLDSRIAGLESGIVEGIDSKALTPQEQDELNRQLNDIKRLRVNAGDTLTGRLTVQRAVDKTVADFNTKVHNDDGVANPDLFRKRKAASAAASDKFSIAARLRARLARLQGGDKVGQKTTGAWQPAHLRVRLAKHSGSDAGMTQSRIGKSLHEKLQAAKLRISKHANSDKAQHKSRIRSAAGEFVKRRFAASGN